jgi:hypothetical protein
MFLIALATLAGLVLAAGGACSVARVRRERRDYFGASSGPWPVAGSEPLRPFDPGQDRDTFEQSLKSPGKRSSLLLALAALVLLAVASTGGASSSSSSCPPVAGYLYGGQVNPALDLSQGLGSTLAAQDVRPFACSNR